MILWSSGADVVLKEGAKEKGKERERERERGKEGRREEERRKEGRGRGREGDLRFRRTTKCCHIHPRQ